MDFKVSYCMVTGVMHPRILLTGWITSDIIRLELHSGRHIIWQKNYTYAGTKAHSFKIDMDISRECFLSLFAYDGEKEKILLRIPAHFGVRLLNRKEKVQNAEGDCSENQKRISKSRPEEKTYDPMIGEEYRQWLTDKEQCINKENVKNVELLYQPLISIIIPVYNVAGEYLAQCIDSILNQTYQNFEICLADDCSTNQDTLDTLKRYEKKDNRVKVCYRLKNGHISLASNSALEMAEGEYVGLVDNDDLLAPTALAEVAAVLNRDRSIDFVYTDEDKLDMDGNRAEPHFKPDFAVDNFLSNNYVCHFSVIRKCIVEKVGGFREGYEGAQDYDLFLRVFNTTRKIHHIPEILYHWRQIPGSTALSGDNKNYAADAGVRALKDYFSNKKQEALVKIQASTIYCVSYSHVEEEMTDIVIESDDINKIKNTIESWLIKMEYQRYRFVIISEEATLMEQLAEYKKVIDIQQVKGIAEFNQYVYNSKSGYFLFWDADNTICDPEWLKVMISYVSNAKIGAVGSNVLHEDTGEFASGYVVVSKDKAIPVRKGYIAIGYSPVNRCLVGKTAYIVSRQHFADVGGFDEKLSPEVRHFDLQLKLHNMLKRNIVVPQIHYLQKEEIGWEEYLPELDSMRDFRRDPWYNPNLSGIIAYQL